MKRIVTQEEKLEKLKLLEEKKKLIQSLPHLYGYKFYPWMRKYFDSDNKMAIVCSANQIGKSSVQIRKVIHWATEPKLWPKLWPHSQPRQFWYLYPSSYLASIEVEKKWIPEFMPRGEMKKHPQYGWRTDYRSKYIQAIHFNTGVSVYFKTYSQDPQDLQAGSCSLIALDEECHDSLVPELQMRLAATNGHFSAVFTPTLALEFWREAIEVRGYKERFPDALKIQVSMYDCLKYEDGSNSFWTVERIEQIKRMCKSQAEVDRRVYGKFVLDSGLKYQAFTPQVNVIEPHHIPKDWPVYIGVDSGSGGKFNHPAAISFVAMRPDYQYGVVFKGKRFDGITTTNSDLVALCKDMRVDLENPVLGVYYDYSATDLFNIASQMGETWIPAEKSHLIGEQYINVAFKNSMLAIFNTEELAPLISELKSLKQSTPKNQAHDDAIDSMRYAITKIPWDWSGIGLKVMEKKEPVYDRLNERRNFVSAMPDEDYKTVEEELEAWDSLIYNEYHDYT